IDFAETKSALRTNIATRQKAEKRLAAGEAVVIFPSGGVATAPNVFGKAEELPWKRFTAKLIQKSQAAVLPVYVEGQNSFLFQLASRLSLSLRLGLLLHEARNKMGTRISIQIGDPIPFENLVHLKNRQALLEHLQESVESLAP
ncbi:MAG: glycerol acyltransferase, partial [Bacteroidota bacterium]